MMSDPAEESRGRVARLTSLAEHVWENREDAREFLDPPHPLLGGGTPRELVKTEAGVRQAESLLMKLEYGLPV